ncbi:patellin-3-like isoform X2 [Rosa rugosa]|uniref:patellin-3-like isoform X2 n=1 Tax=Rosa rugosa TaxID=74645 RepID=UPI002B40FE79|nr:patellin-3-like isoform X2 [Rosa rugosa]
MYFRTIDVLASRLYFYYSLSYEYTGDLAEIRGYISAEHVPIQYGGLSVDYCECNPEFTIADPVAEVTIKLGTKKTLEIIIYEKCTIIWELCSWVGCELWS